MRAIILAYFVFWVIGKIAGQNQKEANEEEKETSAKNARTQTTLTRAFGLDIEDPKATPTKSQASSLERWLETEDLAKARKKHAKKDAKKQKTAAPMSLREELERSRQGKSNFDMKAERLRDRAEDMKVEHLSDLPRDFMKPEKLEDEHHIEYAPIAKEPAPAKDAYEKKEKKAHPRVSFARKAILYREIIDEPVSMRKSRMF